MTTLTDRQIRTLRSEALAAGDLAQMAICTIALGEDAPGVTDPEAADGRGWFDLTGSGMSRADLAAVEAVRAASNPAETARELCAEAIASAQG